MPVPVLFIGIWIREEKEERCEAFLLFHQMQTKRSLQQMSPHLPLPHRHPNKLQMVVKAKKRGVGAKVCGKEGRHGRKGSV